MKLRVLSTAEAEDSEAACWYDDQSTGLGELFLAEYATAIRRSSRLHLRFGPLETESAGGLRRCILKRFPDTLIFEVYSDEVVGLAIAHTSRRPAMARQEIVRCAWIDENREQLEQTQEDQQLA